MEIKVLGPGCKKCEKTAARVNEAVSESDVSATVVKITDMLEIAGYGVMATPAVVVDGEVKCAGKVPAKKDILKWLR
jgi:small redox-active disulfide protein 2